MREGNKKGLDGEITNDTEFTVPGGTVMGMAHSLRGLCTSQQGRASPGSMQFDHRREFLDAGVVLA